MAQFLTSGAASSTASTEAAAACTFGLCCSPSPSWKGLVPMRSARGGARWGARFRRRAAVDRAVDLFFIYYFFLGGGEGKKRD